ncbi:MAG: DNA-directed DNA polymerase II small subunit [Thermoplasmata archaeon]|nr:DNA-directed DNA polymerase II small subunit [Thermoplasmata archaeon]
MQDPLIGYFQSHRKLVEGDALDMIRGAPQPLDLSRKLIEMAGTDSPFVTRAMVESLLGPEAPTGVRVPTRLDQIPGAARPEAAPVAAPPPGFELLREGFEPLPADRDPLQAYGALFAHRFAALSRILRGRSGLPDLHPTSSLRTQEGELSIIGMVREIRTTSEKHHTILTVEDDTGTVEVLVPKGSPTVREPFLLDEVVGLRVRAARERNRISIVTGVLRPDVPTTREMHRTDFDARVLFVSDLHVGSRSFMGEAWGRLVDFLKGQGPDPAAAEAVRHVVIAGDLVDGIGIYPHQEDDLAILDIFEQYAELGRRLREIPSRIQVVAIPGNHDAVSPAEPQPALPLELAATLPSSVRVLGNPATFSLDGVVVTAYHGRAFDDLIPALPGASYARPTDVMKRMLAMRHLAPMYGGKTPLSPQSRDGLLIDPVPDIFVTGHAHTFGVDQYKGILLLNASTWQAETEYQRMRNISPVPARAALVRLTDLSLEVLDFSRAEVRAADEVAA